MNESIQQVETTAPMRRTRCRRLCPLLVFSALTLVLSGCGTGNKTTPQVGAIAFTNATGVAITPISSVTVGTGVYLDVVITNDPQLLGVNWTVSCSSELAPGTPLPPGETVDESCGFFTPVHTASAPVPAYATSGSGIVTFYQAPYSTPSEGTVTLHASSTTDPSIVSSITLAVMP